MPAESRQKPLSFNRTEKNELFQSTGRTLFYLKHWGQLTTDSSVLDIVKGYRRRFKARPHQFYRPITNPKSSKKFQAIKTESEFSSLKRCNKADSQVSSKICVPSVHCSQHVWRFKTSDKPEASTSISAFANIQDLRSLRFESYLRAQRLYDHDRSVRQLYDSSYRGRVKKLSVFSISRSNIQFSILPFGLNDAPRAFTKTLKPPVGNLRSLGFKMVLYLDDIILDAFARELCIYQDQILLKTSENLGFVINLEKSNLVPSQVVPFLGFIVDSRKCPFHFHIQKFNQSF